MINIEQFNFTADPMMLKNSCIKNNIHPSVSMRNSRFLVLSKPNDKANLSHNKSDLPESSQSLSRDQNLQNKIECSSSGTSRTEFRTTRRLKHPKVLLPLKGNSKIKAFSVESKVRNTKRCNKKNNWSISNTSCKLESSEINK